MSTRDENSRSVIGPTLTAADPPLQLLAQAWIASRDEAGAAVTVEGRRDREGAGWRPSFPGKLLHNAGSWSLQMDPQHLRVRLAGLDRVSGPAEVPADAVLVRPGWLWST